MTRASEKTLAELHESLARSLQEKIDSGEASAAELAVAAKFLKDNSIFAAPEQSGAMDELQKQLDDRRAKRKIGMQDLDGALRSIGSELVQ